MDDLTRERYPHGVPYHEAKARPPRLPGPPSMPVVSERRIVLCGTDSLELQEKGGDQTQAKNRRLVALLTRWKP